MKFKTYVPAPGPDATHVRVSVWYDLGGLNHFSGGSEPRGIYLSAAPVTLEAWEGSRIERAKMFKGRKVLLEGLNRLSQKKLDAWVAVTERDLAARQGKAWALVEQVAAENGLALEPEGVPA